MDPWPLPHRADLRDRLLDAYAAGRAYHDRRHLAEVLARIAELGGAGDIETVLAAWFHDAVYVAGSEAAENEERSAVLAEQELAGEEVDVGEVARLVRLTATHRPEPGDRRGEVLCDADLAILAADPERYAEYSRAVRREYAEVPEDAFRRGRLAILRDLAAKPSLFHTAHARRHWEDRARRNLAREIAELSA